MPVEVEQFSCPVCGMHAPTERLYTEEPFEFKMFKKTLGGKIKLSDADRERRRGSAFRRGSAHGSLEYEEIEISAEVRNQLAVRLDEVIQGGLK